MADGSKYSLLRWLKKCCSVSLLQFKVYTKTNAVNIKEELLNTIKDFDMGKFIHLGMDGPSTNWNVLDLINDHQVANGFQKTLDIGSCSLHILHGAFQTGIMKPGWEIGKILKALYKIFNESPARCNVYLHEGTSEVFPMKFCSTRWIEDQPVADRALEVCLSVVPTVKHWQSLNKSKRPKNSKSYDTLVEYHQDLFIPVKFHFFSFIAQILKPFLVIFQSDSPLLPFMFGEISIILYCLVRLLCNKKGC